MPVIPTRRPTVTPSAAPTMGPTKAGVQVYFNGSQVMNGLSASEFLGNVIVVEAWKATVALSCARNQSKLVRVDINSVDDVFGRRLFAHNAESTLPYFSFRSLGQDMYQVLSERHVLSKAAKVNFQVSYTQADFNSTANLTTHMLKANYERSVTNRTFNTNFVAEVEKRTPDSQVIVDTVQPSVVVLSNNYRVIQTTEMPSYRPTAVPSTGTCVLSLMLILFNYSPAPFYSTRCPDAVLESLHGHQNCLQLYLRDDLHEHHVCPGCCVPRHCVLHSPL